LSRSEESIDAGTLAARQAVPEIKQKIIDRNLSLLWQTPRSRKKS
jgi:hypothetical protein